jgi:hypothetical protein
MELLLSRQNTTKILLSPACIEVVNTLNRVASDLQSVHNQKSAIRNQLSESNVVKARLTFRKQCSKLNFQALSTQKKLSCLLALIRARNKNPEHLKHEFMEVAW